MVRSGSAQERLKGGVTRSPTYDFEPFRLDGARRQLLRAGHPIAVPPKAYDILLALVENRERVVERDELMQLVWPDVAVEEANLTQNVFTLRKILGDDQAAPHYIETLPRRGYRFIAPVTAIHVTASSDDEGTRDAPSPLRAAIRKFHHPRRVPYVAGILTVVAALGAFTVSRLSVPASIDERVRLAVLPFVNLSADPEQEYFSDGLTEELIAQLGHLRPERLAVIARTTAMRYKDARRGVTDIGRELGVQYVVEGSVRRSLGQVRVTARLVNVLDQTDLWTDTYDRTLADIFAIQRDIAARVSHSLALELLPDEQRQLRRVRTTIPSVYESYLLGLFHWNKVTKEGARKSIEYFERAIQLDPAFAPAYARLAISHNLLASSNFAPDREEYPKARDAARRALELDDTLAEAHTALGFVKWRFDWDWSGARKEITRGLELGANDPTTHHVHGLYLYSTADFDEAIAAMEKGQRLDPLNFLGRWNLGRILLTADRLDAATSEFRQALELQPNHAWPHMGIGRALAAQGRSHEAITELERASTVSDRHPHVIGELAYAYAQYGNPSAAERLADELAGGRDGEVPAYYLASVHHALGNREAALAWLEKAYAARDDTLVYLNVDPMFKAFRADPGVQDLIRRIGIPR